MGAEDFSFMLNARPGAFIFVGNGDSAGLHHPSYDFNDDVIPIGPRIGLSWWKRRWRVSATFSLSNRAAASAVAPNLLSFPL